VVGILGDAAPSSKGVCDTMADDEDPTTVAFRGGEVLAGKYRVEKVIGQGGMGLVLLAEHLVLNQKVAIKLLHESGLGHTAVVGRFMREARAAVRLRSEHVARVIDVGALDDGRPFIVMEYLEGQDLGDVIDKGPRIPIVSAIDYVLQACEAIAEAHAAGIIHRDLKPKNLFLTHAVHGKPLVKVLDFGISKIDPAHSPHEMQLTKTSEVIGSPSYMSPEQLRSSRNVDTRTDIWALGVILYELLSGRVPFSADTMTELVVVIVTEREPILQQLRPDIPDALAAIVSRCLEKHPEHRFQNVLELAQALEPFAPRPGEAATATERIRAVSSGRPMIGGDTTPMAPAPQMTVPVAASSSRPQMERGERVAVHGGTSVAWAETQSQVNPVPFMRDAGPVPPPSKSGLIVGLIVGGLIFAGLAAGTTGYLVRRQNRASAVASAVATGASSAMPLPEGRKDLPPLPPGSSSAPAETAPTPPALDPPAASALPETRKPAPPPASAAKVAPPPPVKPKGAGARGSESTPKPDDLSGIGRR
jgi:eukaryotic-like serine/threonine-protein kinase